MFIADLANIISAWIIIPAAGVSLIGGYVLKNIFKHIEKHKEKHG